jgi:heme/copper-type cytochrome/quinol oxidase subunit 2
MVSHNWSFLVLVPLLAISLIAMGQAFGQTTPEQHTFIRVEVWALFYRLMVVAFVIGAIVMGVIGYIVFRFRESNKKNIPSGQVGGAIH